MVSTFRRTDNHRPKVRAPWFRHGRPARREGRLELSSVPDDAKKEVLNMGSTASSDDVGIMQLGGPIGRCYFVFNSFSKSGCGNRRDGVMA